MQHKTLSSANTERLLRKAIIPPKPVSLQGFVVETDILRTESFFFWKVDSMVHFESQTSPNESQLHLPDLHSKTFCSFFFFFFFDFQCWKFSLGNPAGSFLIFTALSKKICAGWSVQKPMSAFWEDTSIGRDRGQCCSQTSLVQMPTAWEKQHTLPFNAHAEKCLSAAPYTTTHLEHSQRLRMSPLSDFSLTQWELPLCLLNAAGGRKRKMKSSATK